MLDEDSEYITLGTVILCIDEDDLGTSESMKAFYDDVKEFVANVVVIKPVEFTQSDFTHIEGL